MRAALGGLGPNGTFMVIGVAPSLEMSPGQLISSSLTVKGWYSGMSIDSEDTLAFSLLTGVRSMNEVFPLERVSEAYDRMMSGKAKFRVVLTMQS
jgi:D-arabinose 1-dehydrogenase-like Zn-dependent alcohol dehydrogenase